jgi:hypothetical protein
MTTVDYTCSVCGLDHGPRELYQGCPHASRSLESLARLHATREARELARVVEAKQATNAREMAALASKREHQEAAVRQERTWGKTSALLQDVLAAYRADREAAGEATLTAAKDILEPMRFVERLESERRLKRLIERFG